MRNVSWGLECELGVGIEDWGVAVGELRTLFKKAFTPGWCCKLPTIVNYDYNKAIISDALWFAEGVTSYYDLSFPMLAGLSSKEEYLVDLARDISHTLSIPGRYYHSIADSSREAWVKLYNSSRASNNTQISY